MLGHNSYKVYKKVNIGLSQIASLIVRTSEGVSQLHFSKNGYYYAYLVDDKAKIDKSFTLLHEAVGELAVYDDDELTFHVFGDTVKLYQCNDDIIIQVINPGNIFVNNNEPIFKAIRIEKW